ncbi:MAG: CPBP family intramembrane metalloprotease [Acidobacteria bacterium]|nr:CPBP family intramembrane metalloprotease [Acidobacteriota bacterium]
MPHPDEGDSSDKPEDDVKTWLLSSGVRAAKGLVPFRTRRIQSGRWKRPETSPDLPLRYDVRPGEGESRLRCLEAPGLEVSIFRSFAYTEVEARKLGEQVILLDGAGQFAPTLDHERRLYNLDHHQGCLRAFTLATCEQALILVLKGLELDRGDWKVFANEPDLDTIFAIWILLNHRRLRELSQEARDVLIPLLRLEGAIDANGFELAEFCGLPKEIFDEAKEELDRLHQRELELKRTGRWGTTDLAAYTQEMLGEIDRLVYEESDFSNFARIEEEYGHVEIGPDRLAVVCRDSSGIYEVEKRLKSRWGKRLGIIALETAPSVYTLRRTASFAGIDLAQAYARLNLEDPAVDGRPPEKRWGGSDEIGGSPRPGGTGLPPESIGRAIERAFRPREALSGLKTLGRSLALTIFPAAAALVGGALFHAISGRPQTPDQLLMRFALAAAFALFTSAVLVRQESWSRGWIFGFRRPSGRDWLWLLLPALASSSSLTPFSEGVRRAIPGFGPSSFALLAVALLMGAVTAEVWFRGLVHGRLVLRFPIMRVSGPWFVSVPALVSSLLFSGLGALMAWMGLLHQVWPTLPGPHPLVCAALAFVLGLVLAVIRERSLSLWPGFLVQLLGGAAALLVNF